MVKKLTATDEIIQDLAAKIISNTLQENEKLPNERELAETYGVARGRVREALRGLSTVGLITIRSGQGSFVTALEDRLKSNAISWLFCPPQTTFSELFEAREMLDKSIYLTAFDRCNNLDLQILQEKIEWLTRASEQGIEAYAHALDQFDSAIAKITRNPMLLTLMQAMIYLRRDTVERLLKVSGSIENSKRLRVLIYDAFVSRDKQRVSQAMDDFYSESKKPIELL